MPIKTIYIRSKGSITYGWGHVLRSVAVSEYLNKTQENVHVTIAIDGDTNVDRYFSQSNLETYYFSTNHPGFNEARFLEQLKPDAVILDILEVTTIQLQFYKNLSKRLVVFSDLGYCYAYSDIIICPQILSSYPLPPPDTKLLAGPDYFVITDDIRTRAKKCRNIARKASSVLIVMGGSIQSSILKIVIHVISQIKEKNIWITLMLGYDSQIDEADMEQLEEHKVTLVNGTDQIGKYMEEADLALASSGYVKYELAALGTPMILVGITDHQELLGRIFCKTTQCGYYFGKLDENSVTSLAGQIDKLLKSYSMRCSYSQKGKEIVDCNGLGRICESILNTNTNSHFDF